MQASGEHHTKKTMADVEAGELPIKELPKPSVLEELEHLVPHYDAESVGAKSKKQPDSKLYKVQIAVAAFAVIAITVVAIVDAVVVSVVALKAPEPAMLRVVALSTYAASITVATVAIVAVVAVVVVVATKGLTLVLVGTVVGSAVVGIFVASTVMGHFSHDPAGPFTPLSNSSVDFI